MYSTQLFRVVIKLLYKVWLVKPKYLIPVNKLMFNNLSN